MLPTDGSPVCDDCRKELDRLSGKPDAKLKMPKMKTPENFEDCIRPDALSDALYRWQLHLKKLSAIAAFLVCFAGLLCAVFCAFAAKDALRTFLIVFLSFVLGAAAVFLLLRAISFLLKVLGGIYYNTSITAKISLFYFKE